MPPATLPLVSVVMPAHNAARTLRLAMDSVFAQTLQDLELIVCDDASGDATWSLLEACPDPRLVRLRNAANLGPGRSRDRAIAAARGRWIAFIDADDAWLPDRLATLLQAAAGREDVLVFDNIMQCLDGPDGLVPWKALRGRRPFGYPPREVMHLSLADLIRSPRLLLQPLIPTRAIREQELAHSALRFAEDTEFLLGAIAWGLELVYVNRPLYLYRLTPGSLSTNPERARLMLAVLERARDSLPLTPEEREAFAAGIARVRAEVRYQPFLFALKARHYLAATRLLLQHPSLLLQFGARLAESVYYRLSLLVHGARGK